MSTFWKNLHGLAQGQLFNGGHLAPATVVTLVEKDNTRCNEQSKNKGRRQRTPWPRIAAYR